MRSGVYKGLLLFIILAGLPTIAIPKLRNRLSSRIQILKTAWMPNEQPSVTPAGANANPFPKEYEKLAIQKGNKAELTAIDNYIAAHKSPVSETSPIKGAKILPASKQKAVPYSAVLDSNSSENGANPPADSANSLPIYKQGKNEKEAYELVLKSNKTLAAMVQGENPALHWKTWGAAHRGDDSYWVRVIFINQEKTEIEYIWLVKITSGEISPLSYNARSIS
jgi:hypothetical protein